MEGLLKNMDWELFEKQKEWLKDIVNAQNTVWKMQGG